MVWRTGREPYKCSPPAVTSHFAYRLQSEGMSHTSSTSCRMTRLSYSYSYRDPPTPQCRATLHRESIIVIDYSFYCLTTVSLSKFISCHYSVLAFLFTLSDCLVSPSSTSNHLHFTNDPPPPTQKTLFSGYGQSNFVFFSRT